MNTGIRHTFIATAPAALLGCWGLGRQIGGASVDPSSYWQLAILDRIGIYHEDPGLFSAAATGLGFLLPLLAVSLIVSRIWAEVFARLRRRPLDPGWHLTAWLFALLLPATMPPAYAALGLSFGAVFGSHVFGGSGRYLVNPALLGIVFLVLAYPPLTAAGAWLPGADAVSSWAAVNRDGLAAAGGQGTGLGALFLGNEAGALGATSALACLLGAAWLVGARVAAFSVVAAGLAGLAVAAAASDGLPWTWHLALGNFAFLLAFVATDTSVRPTTGGGRIAYGALFGALTVAIRTANPDHPEGTWFALLLAMLCVPLLDYFTRAAQLGRLPDTVTDDHERV